MQPAELVGAYAEMLPEEKKQVRQGLGMGDPTQKTRDRLWLIVIGAFAFVLVGAFTVLAVGVFVKDVKPELILTTFTSVVGFLAGLFIPSPMGGSKTPTAS